MSVIRKRKRDNERERLQRKGLRAELTTLYSSLEDRMANIFGPQSSAKMTQKDILDRIDLFLSVVEQDPSKVEQAQAWMRNTSTDPRGEVAAIPEGTAVAVPVTSACISDDVSRMEVDYDLCVKSEPQPDSEVPCGDLLLDNLMAGTHYDWDLKDQSQRYEQDTIKFEHQSYPSNSPDMFSTELTGGPSSCSFPFSSTTCDAQLFPSPTTSTFPLPSSSSNSTTCAAGGGFASAAAFLSSSPPDFSNSCQQMPSTCRQEVEEDELSWWTQPFVQ